MSPTKTLLAAALALPVVALAASAQAAPGVRTGSLSCDVGASAGKIIGSKADLTCTYKAFGASARQDYTGTLSVTGLDVGISRAGRLQWTVFAPAYRDGQLSGTYRGATAGVTAGVGAGVNALVGGADGSITLQPLSVQTGTGFGAKLGYASLTLETASPVVGMVPAPRAHRPMHHHRPMH